MRIRFLQTTPSDQPDFPFQPGQIIVLAKLTSEVRRWLREERVQLLPDPPTEEVAVLDAPSEMAVQGRPKGRGSR